MVELRGILSEAPEKVELEEKLLQPAARSPQPAMADLTRKHAIWQEVGFQEYQGHRKLRAELARSFSRGLACMKWRCFIPQVLEASQPCVACFEVCNERELTPGERLFMTPGRRWSFFWISGQPSFPVGVAEMVITDGRQTPGVRLWRKPAHHPMEQNSLPLRGA